MSLLDRWVANTKRVLAKDKITETEYEFESVFPDGAPDGTAFSAENMNKIIDAVNAIDESKGKSSGIATLNSSGKLEQMPTAADIGARPSTWMPTAADVGAVPLTAYREMGPYYSDGATAGVKDVIYYACEGITPGAYQLLATGNHNPGGSPNYRSVYVAIIGISVGYNYEAKRQVVRCEITPILLSSNDTGQYKPVEAYLDNKAGGSATEIPYTAGPYKLFIRLIRNDTTSQAVHWDVRLHKLI